MKKSFLVFLALVLAVATAVASPFVASDPDPNHIRYRVRISQDGVNWGGWTEGQPQDQHLWFDFGQIAPGNYNGEAQALMQFSVTDTVTGAKTTVEEWSSAAPFSFVIPTGVRGIKIAK
jgi:hypothetical protein